MSHTEVGTPSQVLSLVEGSRAAKESQDERQGKMLLHTEHSLLALLTGVQGVVQKHQTFMDTVPEEEEGRYTGRRVRRVVLVLDCLAPHDFSLQTRNLVNLQHHVIREKKLTEKETLVIFYAVIEIVCNLHQANIVHRDLKLGNIVLDRRSNKVTVTNFCLGKHLMNDTDLLKDQRGSPAYISPDVLSGKPYLGKPSDLWALGVVLYTMLYGQFPFYDSAPQELFNKIKTAEFSIPDDGRVSEDTKSVIKRLLVTDPERRLTAEQVKAQVEAIIIMWRNISPAAGAGVQEVPVWRPAPRKEEARGGGPQGGGQTHESVLLNLSQGREGGEERRKGAEVRGRGRGGIPVHRLGEDARPLTAEEYRLYSPVITELRGGTRARRGAAASSVAQVLVRQRPGAAAGQTPPSHPAQAPPPHLSTLPATVPDQAEVLDLSSGPRRDAPPPRPVPPPFAASAPTPAHSRAPRHEDRALSLVGALRRLGTRVNLVPVNFSSGRRSGAAGREERRRAGWAGGRREERRGAARDRSAAVIERLSEYRRGRTGLPRTEVAAEAAGRPTAFVSRMPPEVGLAEGLVLPPDVGLGIPAEMGLGAPVEVGLGIPAESLGEAGLAMPLAEATRLLSQGWEPRQLREADQFVRDLEAGGGVYNPAHPTEEERGEGELGQVEEGVEEVEGVVGERRVADIVEEEMREEQEVREEGVVEEVMDDEEVVREEEEREV